MIEKYLAGELIPEEKSSFENLLKSNSNLRDLLKLHLEIDRSILESDIHNFRNLLQNTYVMLFENKNHKLKNNNSIKRFSWRMISIAAVLLTIIIVGGSLLFRQKIVSPNEIYSRFYTPYQADVSVRSTGQLQNGLTLAIQLYQKKDYNTAFEILGNLLNDNKDNPVIRFYYGITAMELNRYETAIYQMNELVSKNQQPFAIHAEWYLGLCYLKLDDESKARTYFENIVRENGYYSSRAQEILKKLP